MSSIAGARLGSTLSVVGSEAITQQRIELLQALLRPAASPETSIQTGLQVINKFGEALIHAGDESYKNWVAYVVETCRTASTEKAVLEINDFCKDLLDSRTGKLKIIAEHEGAWKLMSAR